MSRIIKPGEQDFYHGWVELKLKINPQTGEMHAVGGDRADGDPNSDRPYIGFELLKDRMSQMTFNGYQQIAMTTRDYPEQYKLIYPALGLAGEIGEFCNKVKKIFRDDDGNLTEERLEQLLDELGDSQWYIAACAFDLGLPLELVILHNIKKLQKRQKEGTIHGHDREDDLPRGEE